MTEFQFPDGATPLDPDEMEGLKLGHITSRDELNRFEQDNINDALQWLSVRRKGDILTEKFIKTLHGKMFGKVWKWAGIYRRSGKNIGVDWQQISIQLNSLLKDVHYWIGQSTYPPDEIAVRFHHRLVAIHPFANGNGRHARLMTDILIEDVLKQQAFTWSINNLNGREQVRKHYINALKKADHQDYSMLLKFVRSDQNTD